MRRATSGLMNLLMGILAGVILFVVFVVMTDPNALVCPEGRGIVCVAAMFGR